MAKLLAVCVSPAETPSVSAEVRSAFQAAFAAGAYLALKLAAGASSPPIPALVARAVCSFVHALSRSLCAL